jgi:Zn-dependent protease with chaperone function
MKTTTWIMLALTCCAAANSGAQQAVAPAAPVESSLFARAKAMLTPAAGSETTAPTTLGGVLAGPGQIKQITQVAQIAAIEYDPECKSMVQPFDVTDNVKSMMLLGLELGMSKLPYVGNGSNQNTAALLRQAGKSLNWLPADAERMLGERMHADLAGELLDPERKNDKKLIDQADQMLRALLAQVEVQTPYQFQVAVRKSAGNAQALPGGFIHIDRDLVALPKNKERAYFALAHELAHVLQRHETRATQARLTDAIDSFDGLKQLITTTNKSPAAVLAYASVLSSRFVAYSKAQEMQADACAVRLLDGLYPDRASLARVIGHFQDSLGPEVPDSPANSELQVMLVNIQQLGRLNDQHPNSRERKQNLGKMLQQVSAAPRRPARVATPASGPVASGQF